MFSTILNFFGCGDKSANKTIVDSSDLMQDFRQNIEANRILTRQILDTTADDKLEDKIIANINSKLNPDFSDEKNVLPTLSTERQTIYFIHLVEMEVNNGGLDQFYLNKFVINDESYMFEKTIDAFNLIGATRFAEIIKTANRIFKENETDLRNKEGLFEQLDQQFYDNYKHENLHELTIKFIRNSIETFIDK